MYIASSSGSLSSPQREVCSNHNVYPKCPECLFTLCLEHEAPILFEVGIIE